LFLQQLVNGLTVGSVYALIALGYTMVYGILELINFAHGEIYMIGAYLGIIAVALATSLGLGGFPILLLVIAFVFAMAFSASWGVTIERLAYRPLRQAPRLAPLITALGVSIFLQNFVMVTQGTRDKVFRLTQHSIPLTSDRFTLGNAQVSYVQVMIVGTAVFLMVLLSLFIGKTKLGKAMRATAQDQKMAYLVGIDINRVISVTFLIGSALGAAAGVMVALYYGLVNFFIGYIAGIKAFTAAVLGGIGNVPGAMLGGIVLGLVESFGAGYISSEYKDVFAFAILVIFLIFRPQGLLGERVSEKV